MGIVYGGPPRGLVTELHRVEPFAAFVETGTLNGGTARWASEIFPAVHTIEKFRKNFEESKEFVRDRSNVTCHLGDSAEILPGILEKFARQPLLLWLDAHFCGSSSAGAEQQCPLAHELAALRQRPGDVILIDDARLFLSSPPPPNDPGQWPGLQEIWEELRGWPGRRYVQVIDDIIFCVPEESPWRLPLQRYAVRRADAFWHHYCWISKKKDWKEKARRHLPPFLSRILIRH